MENVQVKSEAVCLQRTVTIVDAGFVGERDARVFGNSTQSIVGPSAVQIVDNDNENRMKIFDRMIR